MTALFSVGVCLMLHGTAYRIEEVKPGTGVYLLSDTVRVFEEDRTYYEYWKVSYVDKDAEPVNRSRGWPCRN